MSNLLVVVVAVGETFDAHLTLAAPPLLVWKLQAIVAAVPFGTVISVKEFTLLVFTLVILNALIVIYPMIKDKLFQLNIIHQI